jgi:hypothetical protein
MLWILNRISNIICVGAMAEIADAALSNGKRLCQN